MKVWRFESTDIRRWRSTLLLLVIATGALIAALLVGISDNPPGLALVYGAVTAFLLAWVHGWRSVKRFLVLFGLSLLSFFVTVVLHNLFYALSELAVDFAGLSRVLGFLEVVFFVTAVLVCPPAILIGAIGTAATALLRVRWKK